MCPECPKIIALPRPLAEFKRAFRKEIWQKKSKKKRKGKVGKRKKGFFCTFIVDGVNTNSDKT